MANSPSHRFGQIIGNLLEAIVSPRLEEYCNKSGLYLDHQKKVRPARVGRKVSWADINSNVHDLDFVIERGGTDSQMGQPVAFIEVAWRRYTKHSRNKAQEIQGAILPLAEKYRMNSPFLGAVLAGEFTGASLGQLRSLGFHVLFLPYNSFVTAFAKKGIDIRFDETTPDSVFAKTVSILENTEPKTYASINAALLSMHRPAIEEFLENLEKRVGRQVTRVLVLPLFGQEHEFGTIADAVDFLAAYSEAEPPRTLCRYEIQIEYSNSDQIKASFEDQARARSFLESVLAQ